MCDEFASNVFANSSKVCKEQPNAPLNNMFSNSSRLLVSWHCDFRVSLPDLDYGVDLAAIFHTQLSSNI
jgi:hypothetical protein